MGPARSYVHPSAFDALTRIGLCAAAVSTPKDALHCKVCFAIFMPLWVLVLTQPLVDISVDKYERPVAIIFPSE